MKPILIPRWPAGSLILLALAIPIHALATLPAATARGYPPIDDFWYLSPYLACLFVLLLPFFDNDPGRRRRIRLFYAVAATFALGSVFMAGSVVPHQYNLGAAIVSSVFISPITFPAIIGAELCANWLWNRVRGFSDDFLVGSHVSRFRFSVMALLGGITIIAIILGLTGAYMRRPATSREKYYQSRENILRIAMALDEYRRANKVLPSSDAGPDAALYQLRDLLDASTFDGGPRKAQPAFWDHEANRLVNGDFAYLNDPHAVPNQIVLTARKPSPEGYVLCSTIGGFTGSRYIYVQHMILRILLGSSEENDVTFCE